MASLFSNRITILLITLIFILSLFSLHSYPVNYTLQIGTTLVWLGVFYTLVRSPYTYVYFFSGAMLFSGIWLKFILHGFLKYQFIEPIGQMSAFVSSKNGWYQFDRHGAVILSRAVVVSLVVGLMLLFVNRFAWFLDKIFLHKNSAKLIIPSVYKNYPLTIFYFIAITAVILNVLNFCGFFYATGLSPKFTLIFHLNLLIVWSMLFVIPFCFATMLDFNFVLKRHYYQSLIVFFFIAFLTSISTLSRVFYLLWTLPFWFVCLSNKVLTQLFFRLKIRAFLVGALFFLFFFSSIYLVQFRRNTLYSVNYHSSSQSMSGKMLLIAKLVADRFVGLESIFSTTAYSASGVEYFKRHAMLAPENSSSIGFYSSEILKYKGRKNFSFIPGLVGILNSSHSYAIVFFGMFFLISLMSFFELMLSRFFANRMLYCQLGIILAYFCISDVNFIYLCIVNMVELYLAAFIIIFLQKILSSYITVR